VFNGNALMVAAFAAITLGGALINNGYLSRMLKARGKGKTLADLAGRMDMIEDGFVHDLGNVLERIAGKLGAMQKQMADMERRLNYADKSALMGIIYNPDIHVTDRLRAFNNYLKLGGNGTVLEYAYEELVEPNRQEWTRALDESRVPAVYHAPAERHWAGNRAAFSYANATWPNRAGIREGWRHSVP